VERVGVRLCKRCERVGKGGGSGIAVGVNACLRQLSVLQAISQVSRNPRGAWDLSSPSPCEHPAALVSASVESRWPQ
jgi:hypothetical protein